MWRGYSCSMASVYNKFIFWPCRRCVRSARWDTELPVRLKNYQMSTSSYNSSKAYEELLKVLEIYKSALKDHRCDFYVKDAIQINQQSGVSNSNSNPLLYHNFNSRCCSYAPVSHTSMAVNIKSATQNEDLDCYKRECSVANNISTPNASSPSDTYMSVPRLKNDWDIPPKKTACNFIDFTVNYDPASLNENIYDTSSKLEQGIREKSSLKSENIEKKPEQKKEKEKNNDKCNELMKIHRGNHLARSLKSYIQVCSAANMAYRAHETFLHYYSKIFSSKSTVNPFDVGIYNVLLNCWAERGDLSRVAEIFSLMAKANITPDVQSYVAHLECISRCRGISKDVISEEIYTICERLKANGETFDTIFAKCVFSHDQMERIIRLLENYSDIIPSPCNHVPHTPYNCKLLQQLNDKNFEKSGIPPYITDSVEFSNIADFTSDQMQLESEYTVKVKSVSGENEINPRVLHMRQCVEECEEIFRKDLRQALAARLQALFNDVKRKKSMTLYPYLTVVDPEILLNIMLQEIRNLAESAEFFSPNIKVLCCNIGTKVMNHYFIWLRKKNKVTDKVSFIYMQYFRYLLTPELATTHSPREYWEYLKRVYYKGPTIDTADVAWPHHVLQEVGKFLYELLMENASFDVSKLRKNSKTKVSVRPFYTTYEKSKKSHDQAPSKSTIQIRAHPKICKLYREAKLEELEFDIGMVPMLCPPRPWVRLEAGGLLMTSTPFIRLPSFSNQQNSFLSKIKSEELYPCFDTLNSLSLCPWVINKPVLDLIIEVFKNMGSEDLEVAINPAVLPDPPTVKGALTDQEKKKARRERAILKKQKMEMTGLWFDCLYKLSIANHFRDRLFWFPHNLDFRGRVYPTPPHFNHLGSDLVRSILLFAEGKPLGENGLDWLKIHLINLTGLRKRDPNHKRLQFANTIMPEILDSADNPFSGTKWWQKSDEPWQTLACCKEIANAVRSPDPVSYVSHFPVHQDGSCNGLQHYAALGRDEHGAREVNLMPASSPQDVYSGVAALVEEERKKDACSGNEIAKVLDGVVKRKVVKQTIMTFVYGVTEYGAKLQILKQLKDIPDFPEHNQNAASRYLMKLTFLSIQKMFTATREIQKWFTDCAELITKISGEPVEWVTPLGLPVIQPYHKKTTVVAPSSLIAKRRSAFHVSDDKNSYISTFETYQPPNVRKQKNAFAPNFIHSLDSSHMMLTALFSQRKGITFVSVHDCYWTHPATVEVMNKICREQFVALHSEPILENLSQFFLKKYGQYSLGTEALTKSSNKLTSTLGRVPQKGSFKLEHVIDSIYFFS